MANIYEALALKDSPFIKNKSQVLAIQGQVIWAAPLMPVTEWKLPDAAQKPWQQGLGEKTLDFPERANLGSGKSPEQVKSCSISTPKP